MYMYLTKNFTLDELIRTSHKDLIQKNLEHALLGMGKVKQLAELLQQVRDLVKCPIIVTSGVRCPELNKAVGGAANSQHVRCEAADIIPDGITVPELFSEIVYSKILFDQVILEQPDDKRAWVHISYSDTPRRELLFWDGKKYQKYEAKDVKIV